MNAIPSEILTVIFEYCRCHPQQEDLSVEEKRKDFEDCSKYLGFSKTDFTESRALNDWKSIKLTCKLWNELGSMVFKPTSRDIFQICLFHDAPSMKYVLNYEHVRPSTDMKVSIMEAVVLFSNMNMLREIIDHPKIGMSHKGAIEWITAASCKPGRERHFKSCKDRTVTMMKWLQSLEGTDPASSVTFYSEGLVWNFDWEAGTGDDLAFREDVELITPLSSATRNSNITALRMLFEDLGLDPTQDPAYPEIVIGLGLACKWELAYEWLVHIRMYQLDYNQKREADLTGRAVIGRSISEVELTVEMYSNFFSLECINLCADGNILFLEALEGENFNAFKALFASDKLTPDHVPIKTLYKMCDDYEDFYPQMSGNKNFKKIVDIMEEYPTYAKYLRWKERKDSKGYKRRKITR